MFFAKKDQHAKDHGLLQAVSKLLCKKIDTALDGGANVYHKVGIKSDSLLHCVFNDLVLPPPHEEFFSGQKGKRLGDVITLLIEKGIPVDEKNILGQTPLHAACKYARTHDTESLANVVLPPLLLRGADILCVDVFGNTPLHYAVLHAQSGTCNAIPLLADPKNINLPNIDGDTPLLLAVKGACSLVTVHAMLQAGARVCVRDKAGKLPSDYATFKGSYKAAALLKAQEEKERLDSERVSSVAAVADIKQTPAAPIETQQKIEARQKWVLLPPDKAAQVCDEKEIGYHITHIFNFRAGHVMRIVHNRETRQDTVHLAPFGAVPDASELTDAYAQYKEMGGAVEWSPPQQDIRSKPFFVRHRGAK